MKIFIYFIFLVKLHHVDLLNNNTLYAFTQSGNFYSIDNLNGSINWNISFEPLSSSLSNITNLSLFPNPKDGTLYFLENNTIKFFSVSIPDLIHVSPIISHYNILYTGEKKNSWYIVNSTNGNIISAITTNDVPFDYQCPIQPNSMLNHIHLIKSDYTLNAYSTLNTSLLWNARYSTFKIYIDGMFNSMQIDKSLILKNAITIKNIPADLTAIAINKFNSPLLHLSDKDLAATSTIFNDETYLSDSSQGLFINLNGSKSISWILNLGSPLINLYGLSYQKSFKNFVNTDDNNDIYPLAFANVLATDFLSYENFLDNKTNINMRDILFSWKTKNLEPQLALYLSKNSNHSFKSPNKTNSRNISTSYLYALPTFISGYRNNNLKYLNQKHCQVTPLIEYISPVQTGDINNQSTHLKRPIKRLKESEQKWNGFSTKIQSFIDYLNTSSTKIKSSRYNNASFSSSNHSTNLRGWRFCSNQLSASADIFLENLQFWSGLLFPFPIEVLSDLDIIYHNAHASPRTIGSLQNAISAAPSYPFGGYLTYVNDGDRVYVYPEDQGSDAQSFPNNYPLAIPIMGSHTKFFSPFGINSTNSLSTNHLELYQNKNGLYGLYYSVIGLFISIYKTLISLLLPLFLIWFMFRKMLLVKRFQLPSNYNTLICAVYKIFRISDATTSYSSKPNTNTSATIVAIGKLRFNPVEIIGHGSLGTIVFKGTFENRRVAVKRLCLRPSSNNSISIAKEPHYQSNLTALREIDILSKCDHHLNVIRYYATETLENYIYIALELCQFSFEAFEIYGIKANHLGRNGSFSSSHITSTHSSISYNNSVHDSIQFEDDSEPLFDSHCDNSLLWNSILKVVTPKDLCQQMLQGIAHLHTLNIAHRDIKPQNVLVIVKGEQPQQNLVIPSKHSIRVVISDFGISKIFDEEINPNTHLHTTTMQVPGTMGWVSREITINNNDNMSPLNYTNCTSILKDVESKAFPTRGNHFQTVQTFGELKAFKTTHLTHEQLIEFYKRADCFSSGCVLYYALTGGEHPFGADNLTRFTNILHNTYDISKLLAQPLSHENISLIHLLNQMLSPEPKLRPAIDKCMAHFFFWNREKQLQFLLDFSDLVEKVDPQTSVLIQNLESKSRLVLGPCLDWKICIDEELRTDLRKFRNYRTDTVRDLLRAMRNKKHHYQELEESLKLSLGSIPDEFLNYFTERFPYFLTHVYATFEAYYIYNKATKITSSNGVGALNGMKHSSNIFPSLEQAIYNKYYL